MTYNGFLDGLNLSFSVCLMGLDIHLKVSDVDTFPFYLANFINILFAFDMIANFFVLSPKRVYQERKILIYELILQVIFLILIFQQIRMNNSSESRSVKDKESSNL